MHWSPKLDIRFQDNDIRLSHVDFRDRLCCDLVWETVQKHQFRSRNLLGSSLGETKFHCMVMYFFSCRNTEGINELNQCTELRLSREFEAAPSTALWKLNESWEEFNWEKPFCKELLFVTGGRQKRGCNVDLKQGKGVLAKIWPMICMRSFFNRLRHGPRFAVFFVSIIKFYFM